LQAMNGSTVDFRHRLSLRYSGAICILFTLGFVVRLFVADGYPLVIALAAVHMGLAVLLYRMVLGGRHPGLEAPLLMALSISAITPMLLITGGVNSQLSSLLVCLPFVAAMIGNKKLPYIVLAAVVVLILGMLVFNEFIVDISGEAITGRKAITRAVWLIVAVSVSTGIGAYFQHAYVELTQKLEQQARVDHLTGLLNRRGLESRLDEELQRQKRTNTSLAVLMLDVDNFKVFNDNYGHAAGDQCLVALAECLAVNTRVEDLLARFGGEEFLVVLINVSPEKAAKAAEKLRRKCTEIQLPGVAESVSVTIGMVVVDASVSADREELIKYADEALYRGKLNGRNQVMCSAALINDTQQL